jgi:hypothetical protein
MKTIREATPKARAFCSGILALVALLAPFVARAAEPKKAPMKSGMGAPFGPVLDRPVAPLRSCDSIEPICIHFDATLASADVARLRTSAARAYGSIVSVMRFPAPLTDGGRGGDSRLDVYVGRADAFRFDRDGLLVAREEKALLEDRDAAPAFVVVDDATVRAGGCKLDLALAHGVARASAYGLDLAETPAVVDGFTRYAASIVAPCTETVDAPFVALQKMPWRPFTATTTGSEYFARYLDRHRGAGEGALVPVLLSMAIQHFGFVRPLAADFEYGPAHFRNDPTVFDVLATTLQDQGGALDDLLLEATADRALAHPEAPPTYDWIIPTSTLPRRVMVPRGVEAMGATFIRIDVDRTPKGHSIDLDLEWEAGSRFRWSVLKLDDQGTIVGSVGVPALERARKLTVEVRKLEGVARVLVVGLNTGDPAFPWQPDDPPMPPHGFELGVYEGE